MDTKVTAVYCTSNPNRFTINTSLKSYWNKAKTIAVLDDTVCTLRTDMQFYRNIGHLWTSMIAIVGHTFFKNIPDFNLIVDFYDSFRNDDRVYLKNLGYITIHNRRVPIIVKDQKRKKNAKI